MELVKQIHPSQIKRILDQKPGSFLFIRIIKVYRIEFFPIRGAGT
jgi:hypothetical protein